jgi:beta-glucosidase-like glycosyl hydrolase
MEIDRLPRQAPDKHNETSHRRCVPQDEPGGEGSMSNDARTDAHRKLAHELAVAGTILLRNNGKILPLSSSPSPSVAVAVSPPSDGVVAGAVAAAEDTLAVRIAVIGDEFTGAFVDTSLSDHLHSYRGNLDS